LSFPKKREIIGKGNRADGRAMSDTDVAERISRLSEREREVLRLLVQGHELKSIATSLGLSIHTINDRLREARGKLGVSSSRAAARLLAAEEGGHRFSADRKSGVGARTAEKDHASRPVGQAIMSRPAGSLLSVGVVMLLIAAATLGLWTMSEGESSPPNPAAAPRVIATSPASGAVIPPGPFLLRVTFDQRMQPGSYSYTRTSPETYPDCAAQPILSDDGRTYMLQCTAVAGHHYEIWFNRPPYMNFRGVNGRSSEPHQLLFRVRTH
jgi:DNA-binding CsgD family transcriptional regulator